MKCAVNHCKHPSKTWFRSPRNVAEFIFWKQSLGLKENDFFVCKQHFDERQKAVQQLKSKVGDSLFSARFEKHPILPAAEDNCSEGFKKYPALLPIKPKGRNICQSCLMTFNLEQKKQFIIQKPFQQIFKELIGFTVSFLKQINVYL